MKILGSVPNGYIVEIGDYELAKLQGRSRPARDDYDPGYVIDVHKCYDTLADVRSSAQTVRRHLAAAQALVDLVDPPTPIMPGEITDTTAGT